MSSPKSTKERSNYEQTTQFLSTTKTAAPSRWPGNSCSHSAYEEMRPLNFTRSENVLFALIAGGVVGYFIGKGNR